MISILNYSITLKACLTDNGEEGCPPSLTYQATATPCASNIDHFVSVIAPSPIAALIQLEDKLTDLAHRRREARLSAARGGGGD